MNPRNQAPQKFIHWNLLTSCLLLMVSSIANAQPFFPEAGPIYDDSEVPAVHIEIHPDSLNAILAPGNEQSDHEYPATFIFERSGIVDTVENVGFRLRGNTSRNAQKKSFKVSFNTFESGRKYHGVEKLNLNGEHNDPSVIRSKICWDLFREFRVPASRANHVRLVINGDYYGLYISVEHIDENFVESRFGNNSGNLYKCLWPADLQYLGENPDAYKLMEGSRRVYELKTNESEDDYSDLAQFISMLNTTPDSDFADEIRRVFNVNKYLRVLAVDAAVGSWDNYWYLKNNYYLYHNPATGKFEFIPYDYDNTFGIWWDGIEQGVDWGDRNVYTWGNQSEERPLAERILAVPKFRNRYSYYLKKLMNRTSFANAIYPRIDSVQAMIATAAEADSYRTLDYGYSFFDFNVSYTQPLGGHVTYGLKEFIDVRRNSAMNQINTPDIAPIIEEAQYSPDFPAPGETMSVSVFVEDETVSMGVLLHYAIDESMYAPVTMIAGGTPTNLFTGAISIPANANMLRWYISATDSTGHTSTEPFDTPETLYELQFSQSDTRLYINEFMADNETIITDESGDYEDWIELYNGDTTEIWLGDLYLTDDLASPTQWGLPDTSMAPGEHFIIWTDDDEEDGSLHTNFKLDKEGEEIGLFRSSGTETILVDSIRFGVQVEDQSYGRSPDGGIDWQFFETPTPGETNPTTGVQDDISRVPASYELHQNYPNPFNDGTRIAFAIPERVDAAIRIINVRGGTVRTYESKTYEPGRYQITWDGIDNYGNAVSSGVYIYTLTVGRHVLQTRKMILMK